VASDTEALNLGKHMVLVPQVRGAWASRSSDTFTNSNVVVVGRYHRLINSIPGDNFDQLSLRGYPGQEFLSRAAAIGSLDFRFPLFRLFSGWGTNPVFFENLSGFTFAETALFPKNGGGTVALPSAGGGAILAMDAFIQFPLNVSVEYHHGFRAVDGGTGEVFFGVNVAPVLF
jgi:hypothetical protein